MLENVLEKSSLSFYSRNYTSKKKRIVSLWKKYFALFCLQCPFYFLIFGNLMKYQGHTRLLNGVTRTFEFLVALSKEQKQEKKNDRDCLLWASWNLVVFSYSSNISCLFSHFTLNVVIISHLLTKTKLQVLKNNNCWNSSNFSILLM